MVGELNQERIGDYFAKTDLPAMRDALYLLEHADQLKEAWNNRYPDQKPACDFWMPLF